MKKMHLLILAPLLMVSTPAFAHVGHSDHGSFISGFLHPLSGSDHILAMVAVGLAAVMLGSRARLVIPAAFVGVMLLGFAAALSGVPLPFVEPVILTSAVVIGLVVAVAQPTTSPTLVAAVVGGFAFFHGHAHGAEMAGADALSFGVGFVLATASLHALGIGLGIALGRLTQSTTALRIAGGATALGGALLLAS